MARGRGSRRHPVAHAECLEGTGRARDALPGRSRFVQGGDPASGRDPAESAAVPAGGRRPDRSRASAWPASSPRWASTSAPRAVVLTAGTFLAGKIHVGFAQLRRRPRGRSAGAAAWPNALRELPFAVEPAEDRHAAAHRRAQHRLFADLQRTARRRSRAGVLVRGLRRGASAPGQLLDHAHVASARTTIIRGALDRSPLVHRRDRRRRPALLPVDRGQGRALRRQGLAPDLHRARRPGHDRDLSERHLDLAAVRRAARARAIRSRASSTRISRGPVMRSSTTISIRAD